MKRTVTAVVTTLGAAGILLVASPAGAQQQADYSQRGQFIISADRLWPLFAYSHTSEDEPTPTGVEKNTVTSNQSSMAFFYGFAANNNDLFFTVPRVGFDYVVVPNVTIGGEIVLFFTLGGSTGTETDFTNGSTTTTSTDSPSTTLFGIAPRAGYIFSLSPVFSLWLRGGVSYYTVSQKTTENNGNGNNQITTTNSHHVFSFDIDPQFVITPWAHMGFTAGVTMDIGAFGGHSTEVDSGGTSTTFSAGSSLFYLGVTGGMFVHF
jgi:hypothetical protein